MPPKSIAKSGIYFPVQTRDVGRPPFDLLAEITRARIVEALTPEALASYAGCAAADIRDIEAGAGRVEHLARVMDTLKIDLTGIKQGVMLHDRLVATREAKKWTIEKLAERSRLAIPVIADLERGVGLVADLLVVLRILAPGYGRRSSPLAKGASDKDSRFTPKHVVDAIEVAFGKVTFDPCAHARSPMQAAHQIRHLVGGDGLATPWEGHLVFVNPPYSQASKWLKKVNVEWQAGRVGILLCLSNAKTDSADFHDALQRGASVFLFKGRLKYLKPDGTSEPSPQASMMIALGTTQAQRDAFAQLVDGAWLELRG